MLRKKVWRFPTLKTELRRLIDQWARYSRNGFYYGHCGSVEHKYLSPQCWYAPEPRPPEINLSEVLDVERAITGAPEKNRVCLVLRYVRKVKEPWILSRLAKKEYRVWVKPHDVEDLTHEGTRMVANRLRRIGYETT